MKKLIRKFIIDDFDNVELKTFIEMILEKVLKRLSIEYHDLKIVFNRAKINNLSSHRLYNHKI